jgi:hypothetical protein
MQKNFMNCAEWKLMQRNACKQKPKQSKISQRQVILDRLGLTADEAQLLLG